jgi:hypothetical protein
MGRREMSFQERLALGTPLRLGELARYIGYSRDQVRKWARANAIVTVVAPGSQEQRVPTDEAERIGKVLKIL